MTSSFRNNKELEYISKILSTISKIRSHMKEDS